MPVKIFDYVTIFGKDMDKSLQLTFSSTPVDAGYVRLDRWGNASCCWVTDEIVAWQLTLDTSRRDLTHCSRCCQTWQEAEPIGPRLDGCHCMVWGKIWTWQNKRFRSIGPLVWQNSDVSNDVSQYRVTYAEWPRSYATLGRGMAGFLPLIDPPLVTYNNS